MIGMMVAAVNNGLIVFHNSPKIACFPFFITNSMISLQESCCLACVSGLNCYPKLSFVIGLFYHSLVLDTTHKWFYLRSISRNKVNHQSLCSYDVVMNIINIIHSISVRLAHPIDYYNSHPLSSHNRLKIYEYIIGF